ncbi:hypothetical protein [Streptomyces sp. NBC_01450]|uniref:hypothetical protein n=1 Tax=Streptomyces sp. NBC_01450 TaxID=2903871 RepID=UPI002E31F5B0|nr:hypothetical protein [Streptomyces sp. NBC_01450]
MAVLEGEFDVRAQQEVQALVSGGGAGERRRGAGAALLAGAGYQATSLVWPKGMFSMLPLTPDQMCRLRGQLGIYGTTSGRINIAGVFAHRIRYLAQGIAAVLETPPMPPEAPGGTPRRPGRGGRRTGW